jgi:hypothetical protein
MMLSVSRTQQDRLSVMHDTANEMPTLDSKRIVLTAAKIILNELRAKKYDLEMPY